MTRVLALLPTLALVLVLIFALTRLIPGDPAVTLLGPGATDAQIAALRDQLRLDQPLLGQFLSYAGGVLRGDLGTSLKSGAPVLSEIMARLPATLEISLLAAIVAVALGIPLGVFSAIRADRALDHAIRLVSLAGVSMPAFLLALLLQIVFGIWLGWLPISGRTSAYFFADPITGFPILDALIGGDVEGALDAARHLVLPVTVLAAFLAATLGRFIRNALLEVLDADYIRTARAKGLAPRTIILVHALRNALLPALTILGLKLGELLGGAILTETVFAWPGIGRYIFDAIRNRDYPVIQGATLVFALMFMLVSLLVDLAQSVLDPRLRK